MAFAQNSCNFAVPGAGKTSIVYAAYSYLKSLPATDKKHVDNLLVVGPLSSFQPWKEEYKACFGYEPEVFSLSGNPDKSPIAFARGVETMLVVAAAHLSSRTGKKI